MNKKEETTKTYNLGAEKLSKKFNQIGLRSEDIDRAFSFLNDKNLNVMEIGCGNGRDAKHILTYTKNYIGIDISREMIKLSKKYLPKANFIIGDIEKINIPRGLDVVFAFASLLHLNYESFEKILNKFHKKINKDGIIYISLKYNKTYKEKIKEDEFGRRFFYFYSIKNLQELASKTGYKIIYKSRQNIRNNNWVTIVLQKTN
ncbi:MAG: class I SAM-dependent methyltransferase [Candidatus Paceibacterota bacterium]|jgi:trans-aconitate methyltransferase